MTRSVTAYLLLAAGRRGLARCSPPPVDEVASDGQGGGRLWSEDPQAISEQVLERFGSTRGIASFPANVSQIVAGAKGVEVFWSVDSSLLGKLFLVRVGRAREVAGVPAPVGRLERVLRASGWSGPTIRR